MNLLPKSHKEFQSAEYWDEFFKKRGTKAFEWYGEYPELCGILHKYIKVKDRVLVIGCGNSTLSENLYDVGYHNIVNIDISDVVIRQMQDKNKETRPDMSFEKMDVMQMTFEDGDFSVVLDKGTLDALMVDDTEAIVADIDRMFGEVERVLRLGGRYICISLLQQHILDKVLEYFPQRKWPVRIHKIQTENSENTEKEFHMPVFAMVFTKFKAIPDMKPILEISVLEDKVQRCDSVTEVKSALKEAQHYALTLQQIKKRTFAGDQLPLKLYQRDSEQPRYTLYVVDSPEKKFSKFAIFIAPEGRESEWMFSTNAGRCQLSESAGFERLIVVTLSRHHKYENIDKVKEELSAHVMELAPPGFKTGTNVPFLSLGGDTGSRTIQHEGHSDLSGDYVVEDVVGDNNQIYRRLIFLCHPNVIQSEAKLKQGSKKKGGKQGRYIVDKSYLACQHHVAMVAGMAFAMETRDISNLSEGEFQTLIIGLGGGGLPTFIHDNFPNIGINVVDIDPVIVQIAKDWFAFQEDQTLKVHVADGIDFIKNEVKQGNKHNVIMLDVDSKDVTVGMSCPPQVFIEDEFLCDVKQCLYRSGLLLLNLVCRDEELKKSVLKKISSVFPTVYSLNIEEEINQILFAFPQTSDKDFKDIHGKAVEHVKLMNSIIKRKNKSCNTYLEESLQKLTLLDT